jgi:hypothetical protein
MEIKIEEVEEQFIPPAPSIANGILKNKTTYQPFEVHISKSASFCGFITTDSQTQTETIRRYIDNKNKHKHFIAVVRKLNKLCRIN